MEVIIDSGNHSLCMKYAERIAPTDFDAEHTCCNASGWKEIIDICFHMQPDVMQRRTENLFFSARSSKVGSFRLRLEFRKFSINNLLLLIE